MGLQRNQRLWIIGVLWVAVLGGGCGAVAGGEAESELALQEAELAGTNGLSTNGLSTNGLSTNGLSTNGLSTNGLSTNGFSTWFGQNPASADLVMQYVARCAMSSTQTLGYTHAGVTYTWTGLLGLAPGWASGQPATEVEQQVVSACLAAHANKFGISIPISVLGRDAQGNVIPYTSTELATYSEKEACFFGNLFNADGLYAANDQDYLNSRESTARACGLTSSANLSECPPIVHVGRCYSLCERAYVGYDAKPYYARCTYNGKTYRPITTRIRPQEIYRCGDGVCQFTESCGSGTAYNNCNSDCGSCTP